MSTTNVKKFLARKKRKRCNSSNDSGSDRPNHTYDDKNQHGVIHLETKEDDRDEVRLDVPESRLGEERSQTHRSETDDNCRKLQQIEAQEVRQYDPDQNEQLFQSINLSPLDSPQSSNSDFHPNPRDFKSDVQRLEQLLEKKDITIQHLSEDLQQTRAVLFQTRNELQASRKQSLRLKTRAFDIHQKFLRWDKMLNDWMVQNRGKPHQEWDARPAFSTVVTPTVKQTAVTDPEAQGSRHGPPTKSTAENIETNVEKPTPTGAAGGVSKEHDSDHAATTHPPIPQAVVMSGDSEETSIDSLVTTLTVTKPQSLPKTCSEKTGAELNKLTLNTMQPPLQTTSKKLPLTQKGRSEEESIQSMISSVPLVSKPTESSRTLTPDRTSHDPNRLNSPADKTRDSSLTTSQAKQEPSQCLSESTQRLFTSSHPTFGAVLTPMCPSPTRRASSSSEGSDDEGLLRDAWILAQQRKPGLNEKQPKRTKAEPEKAVSLLVPLCDKENFSPSIQDPRRVTLTPKRKSERSLSQNSDNTEGSPTRLEKARRSVLLERPPNEPVNKSRDALLPQRPFSPRPENATSPKKLKAITQNETFDTSSSNSPSSDECASSEALLARESIDKLVVRALPTPMVPVASEEKTKNQESPTANDSVPVPQKSTVSSTSYSVARALNGWRSNVMARTFVDEALGPQPHTESFENLTKVINPYKKTAFHMKAQSPSVTESTTMPAPKAVTVNTSSSPMWLNTSKATSYKMKDDEESQIAYKHVEVIRGKKKRECLPGHSCQGCDPFWAAVCDGNDVFDRKQFQDCSRHRAAHSPESTPPNFWDLSFRDEVLARDESRKTDEKPPARESTEI
ncbi:hypothetical protein MHU86_19558 [Fragilaria crotonensis]|nr:hypothetical protein MHU86_19558 [Fragilaria crotonensis]